MAYMMLTCGFESETYHLYNKCTDQSLMSQRRRESLFPTLLHFDCYLNKKITVNFW